MIRFAKILSLVVLLYGLFVAEAKAQMWLENRQYNEGPGIWITDGLVFHPGLGFEGGYVSNPLHLSQDVTGAAQIRLAPYLDLATEPPQRKPEDIGADAEPPKVNFRLGVAGMWDYYFSDNDDISDQSDIGVDTNLNLEVFPEGTWTFLLFDNFIRTRYEFETIEEVGFNKDSNVGQIGVRFSPGGKAMEFKLAYANHLDYFESETLDYASSMAHEAILDAKWRFFPKTALLLKARFMPILYFEDINVDSMPLRVWIGLNGLFTSKFGLLILLGYGNSFHDSGVSFNSFIGKLEADYFIGPSSIFKVGVERDFVDSITPSNFYDNIGGYIQYHHMFIQALLLVAQVGVYYRDYSVLPLPQSTPELTVSYSSQNRWDISIHTGLLIEYRVLDWLAFNASGKYLSDITDFQVVAMDENTGQIESREMKYHRFEVFGGVRFSY